MMLNLFMAVVLEGYCSTNKEHTGAITQEILNLLVEHWVDYDPLATGWIDLKDVIFLIYEVNEPLGKSNLFETEIKEQTRLRLENYLEKNEQIKNKIIDIDKRFVVQKERNMVVPFNFALSMFNKMNLPVYSEIQGDYKCHFRDIVKRLCRGVLEKKRADFDPKGIERNHLEYLNMLWLEKYPDLKTKKVLQGYDSGKLWAALFIVSCVENVA